jgi:hypothetical protein
MKKYFFILFLLILVFISCYPKKPQFVGPNTKVSYFIQGRLRTVELLKSVPFKVVPYYLNSALFGERMNFEMGYAPHFRIKYVKENKEYVVDGVFGDSCMNADMKLIVTNNIKDTLFANTRDINWLIQISNR